MTIGQLNEAPLIDGIFGLGLKVTAHMYYLKRNGKKRQNLVVPKKATLLWPVGTFWLVGYILMAQLRAASLIPNIRICTMKTHHMCKFALIWGTNKNME